jgi:glycerol-3-phosphate dehydrogenase (NAD(P)+)
VPIVSDHKEANILIQTAAVVGATGWGTTLAILLARSGVRVTLLTRSMEEAANINLDGEHRKRLPGTSFPSGLIVSGDPRALETAELVCFVVPAQTMAENIAVVAPHVSPSALLLSGSKGIEAETGRRMTQILSALLPDRPVAALSGPNLSREVAAGLPATTVIASSHTSVNAIRSAFHSAIFRVYTSTDVIGVEFGGALKNVIAIAAGMVDALDAGDNAKAAVVTRGLAEISRVGVAAGADPLTFQGLAGVGDLVATAYSPLSRNRRFGRLIGDGIPIDEALATIGEAVEGVSTTDAALRLASGLNVDLPIASALQAILRKDVAPQDAVSELLGRDPKAEISMSATH